MMAQATEKARPCAPRGFSRVEAAAYIGVSPSTFDAMVAAGEMPAPRKPRTCERVLWDRHELDVAFDDLPSRDKAKHAGASPYDADPA
jgi:excisionase family DNA binding protein